MIAYILFIIGLVWLLISILNHLSSIDAKLDGLSSIDRELESKLSHLSSTDLLDIESHLSSLESDVRSIESDVSSIKEDIKEELSGPSGDTIKDKLNEIIVKLEELIEKK